MSKTEDKPLNFAQKAAEMIKNPTKIVTKPVDIVKKYTEDSIQGKQLRSKIKDYAVEHPVKTAALAGVVVASGAAVAVAATIAVPLFVVNPPAAIGIVAASAYGSSLAFRTASEKLHNLAKENREKSGGFSREDRKTLEKFRQLNQEIIVDKSQSTQQENTTYKTTNQSKIKQALENGGNKIIEKLKEFNNSDRDINKKSEALPQRDLQEYRQQGKKKDQSRSP